MGSPADYDTECAVVLLQSDLVTMMIMILMEVILIIRNLSLT